MAALSPSSLEMTEKQTCTEFEIQIPHRLHDRCVQLSCNHAFFTFRPHMLHACVFSIVLGRSD